MSVFAATANRGFFGIGIERLTECCVCGVEGPDDFGNYDLLEHPDCPLHGEPR